MVGFPDHVSEPYLNFCITACSRHEANRIMIDAIGVRALLAQGLPRRLDRIQEEYDVGVLMLPRQL